MVGPLCRVASTIGRILIPKHGGRGPKGEAKCPKQKS